MCILLHKYSKWSRPIQTYASNKQQWRECVTCGKAQFRTLRWDEQANLSDILTALDEVETQEPKLEEDYYAHTTQN